MNRAELNLPPTDKMDNTCGESDKHVVKRDSNGRILPGYTANPNGNQALRKGANKVRLAFIDAFEKIGGVDKLIEWAGENKSNLREFYRLVGGYLPKDDILKHEGLEKLATRVNVTHNYRHGASSGEGNQSEVQPETNNRLEQTTPS